MDEIVGDRVRDRWLMPAGATTQSVSLGTKETCAGRGAGELSGSRAGLHRLHWATSAVGVAAAWARAVHVRGAKSVGRGVSRIAGAGEDDDDY
jgi:hypothetical protein